MNQRTILRAALIAAVVLGCGGAYFFFQPLPSEHVVKEASPLREVAAEGRKNEDSPAAANPSGVVKSDKQEAMMKRIRAMFSGDGPSFDSYQGTPENSTLNVNPRSAQRQGAATFLGAARSPQ